MLYIATFGSALGQTLMRFLGLPVNSDFERLKCVPWITMTMLWDADEDVVVLAAQDPDRLCTCTR